MLHRFAKFLAACTVFLILAGSLVTSHRLGTVGSRLADEVRLEHVHVPAVDVGRRASSTSTATGSSPAGVGFLTIILAAWLLAGRAAALDALARRRRARRGHRAGLARRPDGDVLPAARRFRPRTPALAEIFFCMTVAIALFTSPGWIDGYERRRRRRSVRRRRVWPTTTTVVDLLPDPRRRRRCGIPARGWRFLTSR